MKNDKFLQIKKITEIGGPSGFEKPVRDLIVEMISPYVSSLKIDKLGNLIATKGNAEKILISAHMDEVGFMVNHISNEGYLSVSPVGGIDPSHLASKRLFFPKNKVYGVIGAKPVHLKKDKSKLTFSDLYVDIGASNKEEASTLVSIGDFGVFCTETELFEKQGKIKGKAIDNRMGCFLLASLLALPEFNHCTCVFTVQEEIGLAGADAFINDKNFSYGIALDVTTPNDLPGITSPNKVCSVNNGPVISFADRRCLYDNALISEIFDILMKNGICCQTKSIRAGGNEAGAFQQDGMGMKAISISIPCRYIHSPVGIVSIKDIQSTKDALLCILKELQTKEGIFNE